MRRIYTLIFAAACAAGILGCGTSQNLPQNQATSEQTTADVRTEHRDSLARETGHFEKVVLDSVTTRPNELDVAPDGRVFYIEREGAVKVWRPETGSTEMVGFIPVKAVQTNGLMGMTLDPDFSDNGWIYVYFSPRGDDTRNELARFTITDNRIEPSSKKVLLNTYTDRYIGGGPHSGGSMIFGPDGNLFLSTGDRTDPTEVELSTPIDERPGREHWDAQRTAGNTMSLQGKILRIRPLAGGGYEIPADNLFPYGAVGRPEIFVMGNRNPFRITVDQKTGWLYWGDYGPSASRTEKRGAAGYDEFNQAKEAGFYGWPYFNGNNKAFRNYDFAADTSGRYYDPKGPVNDSPNNTGARVLPPARPAMIWYPAGPSEKFPEMGVGGRGPMGGAVYRYDEESVGTFGLPPYYDGKLFIMEFMRRWIKEVSFDENGDLAEIKPFLPEMTFLRPFDMDIGPDGSIYLIEWGDNYEGWYNDRAKVVRLKYHGTEQRPPVAAPKADKTSGPAPLTVQFSGTDSYSQNEDSTLQYSWDFDGDGQADASTPSPTYTYEAPGGHTALLTVTDAEGMSSSSEIEISAGNTAPQVTIDWPLHGGIIDLDDTLDYRVTVTDVEDDTIAPGDVHVEPQLAHDSHWHRLKRESGASGTFSISSHTRHLFLEEMYGKLRVSYTDDGGPQAKALTTAREIVLQPRRKDAAHVTTIEGAQRSTEGNIRMRREPVKTFLDVTDGDRVSYAPVNLRNIDSITFRVAPETGGTIAVHLDGPDGEKLGEVSVDAVPSNSEQSENDSPRTWKELTMSVTDPGGAHELYLTFSGPSTNQEDLMRVDWLEFNGPGMMSER